MGVLNVFVYFYSAGEGKGVEFEELNRISSELTTFVSFVQSKFYIILYMLPV